MIEPDITRPSPNHYAAAAWLDGRAIIIHSTRGSAAIGREFQATLNWFASPASGLSAHWVVAQDGTTARVVPDDYPAIHAGEHNVYAFGIELEQPTIDTPFTNQQLKACAAIVRDYCDTYAIPTEHLTGLRSGQRGLLGHDETEQGRQARKSDPGILFPWAEFIALVKGAVATPAAAIPFWWLVYAYAGDEAMVGHRIFNASTKEEALRLGQESFPGAAFFTEPISVFRVR